MTCQDELTKCYEDVIRLNNLIDDTKDYKKLVRIYCVVLNYFNKSIAFNCSLQVYDIQQIVARMMDNDKPRLEALKIKSKVVKSFSQRLKGKEGRFR
jgi:DNA-directed RNA polymerase beta' subunit